MHEWTDHKGERWGVSLTLGTAKRLRDAHGVDLLNADKLAATLRDPVAVADLLWALSRDEAERRGLDVDAFYLRLVDTSGDDNGQSFDAATRALMRELALFFRAAGRRLLADLADQIMAKTEAVEAAYARQHDKLGGAVDRLIDQAETELAQALDGPAIRGGPSTN